MILAEIGVDVCRGDEMRSQAEYEAKVQAQPEPLVRRKAAALGFELVPKAAATVL